MPDNLSNTKITQAALQIIANLSEKWDLSESEERLLLGNPDDSVYLEWKNRLTYNDLPQDTLDRVSYLLGIYKALHILLPSASSADNWIKKPNTAPLFKGNSALSYMLSGKIDKLRNVKLFLDEQCG